MEEWIEGLKDLGKIRDQGLLSEHEFMEAKSELLLQRDGKSQVRGASSSRDSVEANQQVMDRDRRRHLVLLGSVASIVVLIGSVLLLWGITDDSNESQREVGPPTQGMDQGSDSLQVSGSPTMFFAPDSDIAVKVSASADAKSLLSGRKWQLVVGNKSEQGTGPLPSEVYVKSGTRVQFSISFDSAFEATCYLIARGPLPEGAARGERIIGGGGTTSVVQTDDAIVKIAEDTSSSSYRTRHELNCSATVPK